MLSYRFIFLLITVFIMSSCVEVIDLDLKNNGPFIVIDGKITDEEGKSEVKITSSIKVTDKNDFPAVTDAEVLVTDLTSNTKDTAIQSFPGVYKITRLPGIPGHTYALQVKVNSQLFTAISTMPQKVNFDGLSFTTAASGLRKESIQLVATFTDPIALGNYYRFVTYQNGLQSQTIFVRNDIFTNGNQVSQTLFNQNITIVKGDNMQVAMQCIDKPVYDYFSGLMMLQGSNIYQGITPTNPPGNISGGALGYFSAHTAQQQVVFIN